MASVFLRSSFWKMRGSLRKKTQKMKIMRKIKKMRQIKQWERCTGLWRVKLLVNSNSLQTSKTKNCKDKERQQEKQQCQEIKKSSREMTDYQRKRVYIQIPSPDLENSQNLEASKVLLYDDDMHRLNASIKHFCIIK